jgi:hypothetical protein
MEPLLDKLVRVKPVRMIFDLRPNMTTSFGITLRFAIVTFLSGLLSLLVSFWALKAIVFLQHPDQNCGELGFVFKTAVISVFISFGYVISFLLIFLPWINIKHRKHLSNKRLMEAAIGGIVFGVMVLVFSKIVVDCIMGGSLSGLLTELFVDIFTNDICWLIPYLIPAMISGAVTFALAARRAKV